MPEEETRPTRPAIWPAFAAYLVGFLLAALAQTALALAVIFVRLSGPGRSVDIQRIVDILRAPGGDQRIKDEASRFVLSTAGLTAMALIGAFTLLAVALTAARLSSRDVIATLRLGPTRATPVGYLAVAVGTVALNVICGEALERAGVKSDVMEALYRSLKGLQVWQLIAAAAVIGLAPAVAEETFFRGLMQGRLIARWGRWPGIVVTALAFGVIHLDKGQTPVAFVTALFLGWVAERFAGIRPTIVAHAANNVLSVVLVYLGQSDSSSPQAQIAMVTAGAATLGVCTAVLCSRASVQQ